MSLILEALKKAEAQRGPTGSGAAPFGRPGAGGGGRGSPGRWWSAALAAVAAALAVLLVRPRGEAPKPLPPPVLPGPVSLRTEPAAPASFAPRFPPALVPHDARPAPAAPRFPPALVPDDARPTPAQPDPLPSKPLPVVASPPAPAPREAPPADDALRRLREDLDKVTVSAHVFADERAQRFVFLNGKVYREGERVSPEGFVIDAITPDGLWVERDGVRLKVGAAR